MPALGAALLTERLGALVAADVELTPAAVRAVVRELGGGEGRAQVAAGSGPAHGQVALPQVP